MSLSTIRKPGRGRSRASCRAVERDRMANQILVRSEHPEGAYAARVLRQRSRLFLARLGLDEAELSVVVTTDAQIRALNRKWRKKDRPTDVLSFPAGDGPVVPGQKH